MSAALPFGKLPFEKRSLAGFAVSKIVAMQPTAAHQGDSGLDSLLGYALLLGENCR